MQKHLATLREQGLILVEYGPYNRRRPDEEARPDDLTGIDLRPAIVVALELQARLAALAKQRQAATLSLRRAQRALLQGRACPGCQPEPDPIGLEMLESTRRTLRRLRRQLMHPATAQPSSSPSRPRSRTLAGPSRTLRRGRKGWKRPRIVTPGCRFGHR